jgi:amino acid adenylation domain-containing protein
MRPQANKNLLLSSSTYIDQKEYWVKQLAGKPFATKLLAHHIKHDGNGTTQNASINLHITGESYRSIIKLSRAADLSLYIILLSVLQTLIRLNTGKDHVSVISPIYEANICAETLNNYVFIQQQEVGQKNFKQLLMAVRQTLFEAYDNQDYPFDDLLSYLRNSGRHSGSDSHPNVCCRLENIHPAHGTDSLDIEDCLEFSFLRQANQSRIRGYILYNAAKYDEFFIRQLSGQFLRILDHVMKDPDALILEIPILSDIEREQLLNQFNNTDTADDIDISLSEKLAQQIARTPSHTALVFLDQQISYGCLQRTADYIASILRKKGVKPGSIVGLMVERSIEMLMGIWGILKAGGAYLPIEPDYPPNRIRYMIEDSRTELVVTQKEVMETSGLAEETDDGSGIGFIFLEELAVPEAWKETGGIDPDPSGPAYIIYTSGSTGKPKGVIIPQRNVVDLANWFSRRFNVGIGTHVMQLTNYNFDTSVEDIFATHLNGGTLHVADEELIIHRDLFKQYIQQRQIHIINYIPTFLKNLFYDNGDSGGDDKIMDSLKVIITGGEPLDEPLRRRMLEKGYPLYNNYGPTEITTDALCWQCTSEGPILLGKPVDNCRVYVLDKNMGLLPVGAAGELYLSGNGLALGYLNSPETTAEKFLPHPFMAGRRIYRTGDLAMWMPDGNIFFLGREDHQVKIRGYRIELEEIKNRLLAHTDVKEVVVIASGGHSTDEAEESDDKFISAYYVSDNPVELSSLREHMAGELPDYMIPSYFIHIDRIPLNSNGKIDRKALPAPRIVRDEDYKAPNDHIEEKLLKIWFEVLGMAGDALLDSTAIGINSNFFHLGGHSLKATVLAAKIHKAFDVKIQLARVFQTPTIKELARFIRGVGVTEKHIDIEPAEEKEYYLMSSAQRRLYSMRQMEPDSTGYNMPMLLTVEGAVEPGAMESAFQHLIRRHEALRTSFHVINGELVQIVHPQVPFKMEYREVQSFQLQGLVENFEKPFDLAIPPMIRVVLAKTREEEHLLMIDTHHIISDGVSQGILIKDFIALLAGEDLEPLKLQYRDYAQWQNSELGISSLRSQEEFWMERLDGELPVLNLPIDFPRPQVQQFAGDSVSFEISPDNSRALKALALEQGTTLNIVMMTIFNIFLAKMCDQQDIMVGIVVTGRRHADLENIVGVMINSLVLRNFPTPQKTFLQFLQEVKERSIQAYENQDYPFEKLAERFDNNREMGRNPLFDIMFEIGTDPVASGSDNIEKRTNLKFKPYTGRRRITVIDMIWSGRDNGEQLTFTVDYNTNLFERTSIELMVDSYLTLITQVLNHLHCKIEALSYEPVIQNQSDLQLEFKF